MTTESQKHNAVWQWLYDGNCGISDLFFVLGQYDESGELTLNNQVVFTPEAVTSDEWVRRYVDGGGIKNYNFVLSQYAPLVCQSNTPANIVTLDAFERVAEWIDLQNRLKNYPAFPVGCEIQKIEVTPAGVAASDETGAKLQMTVTINYYTREV